MALWSPIFFRSAGGRLWPGAPIRCTAAIAAAVWGHSDMSWTALNRRERRVGPGVSPRVTWHQGGTNVPRKFSVPLMQVPVLTRELRCRPFQMAYAGGAQRIGEEPTPRNGGRSLVTEPGVQAETRAETPVQMASGRLSLEDLIALEDHDPRLPPLAPDMPGRPQPRRIVERSPTDPV
jgi:hypothetical protein